MFVEIGIGFFPIFERLGWRPAGTVRGGTVRMYWPHPDTPPVYPENTKEVSMTECKVANIAAVTGDAEDDRYLTLGEGDGTFQRWRLTDSLLKKLRREVNERLD